MRACLLPGSCPINGCGCPKYESSYIKFKNSDTHLLVYWIFWSTGIKLNGEMRSNSQKDIWCITRDVQRCSLLKSLSAKSIRREWRKSEKNVGDLIYIIWYIPFWYMHSETHEAMHVNKIMFYLKSVFYKHILDKIQNSEITALF